MPCASASPSRPFTCKHGRRLLRPLSLSDHTRKSTTWTKVWDPQVWSFSLQSCYDFFDGNWVPVRCRWVAIAIKARTDDRATLRAAKPPGSLLARILIRVRDFYFLASPSQMSAFSSLLVHSLVFPLAPPLQYASQIPRSLCPSWACVRANSNEP